MYCKAVFVLVYAAPQSEHGVVTVSWTEVDAGEQQRAVAHFRQPYSTSFLRSRPAVIVFYCCMIIRGLVHTSYSRDIQYRNRLYFGKWLRLQHIYHTVSTVETALWDSMAFDALCGTNGTL